MMKIVAQEIGVDPDGQKELRAVSSVRVEKRMGQESEKNGREPSSWCLARRQPERPQGEPDQGSDCGQDNQ